MNMPPDKLYKYVSFGVNALRMLSEAEVYYANPRRFNDPLDCEPTLEIDTDRESLESLCLQMLEAKHGKEIANRRIKEHRYMSTEIGDYKTNAEAERYYIRLLEDEIKHLLDAEMASHGVLSLAARWDSPLMWSHYADQHRGLCIEFDMTQHECDYLRPVDYNRPTSIKISELVQWKLDKSGDAKANVLDTYFLAKSPEWQYEEEWRDISSSNGVQSAPFHVSTVYFGLRCDDAVKASIVKLLADSINSPQAFYEIVRCEGNSSLERQEIDTDEMMASAVRTSPLMDFREFSEDE